MGDADGGQYMTRLEGAAGAGGAGTFSDGKLTTRINDPKCSFVLSVFAEHGAPEEIKYTAKRIYGKNKTTKKVAWSSYFFCGFIK